MKFTIDDSTIPATSAFSLNTTALDDFLPGLVAKYGPDVPMSLLISTHSAPKSVLNPDEIGLIVGVDLNFIV